MTARAHGSPQHEEREHPATTSVSTTRANAMPAVAALAAVTALAGTRLAGRRLFPIWRRERISSATGAPIGEEIRSAPASIDFAQRS